MLSSLSSSPVIESYGYSAKHTSASYSPHFDTGRTRCFLQRQLGQCVSQRGLLGSVISVNQQGSVYVRRLYLNLDAPSRGLIYSVQV